MFAAAKNGNVFRKFTSVLLKSFRKKYFIFFKIKFAGYESSNYICTRLRDKRLKRHIKKFIDILN